MADSLVLEESERKLYSATKRIITFLIDAILTLSLMFFLLFFVSNYTISYFASEEISQLNEIYQEECDKLDYPYSVDNGYGIYQLDFEKYVDKQIDNGLSEKEAIENYYKAYDELDKLVFQHEEANKPYRTIQNIYLLHVIISIFVATIIFELIIPLCNKYHQTLGMLLMKSALVDQGTHIVLSNIKVLLRFFFIFGVELLLVFIILNYIGLIFVGLFTLFFISLTKRRLTFHDAIVKAKIIDKEKAFLE